ncbi:MAG: 2-oxoacid:acceptor oxidoreductase subunit alpha [Proteobacteria bacterium]|nr:2-oxoacid:acceptor oxidoreductase subunit alpha [Pseudomonadota bacterium]
MPETTTLEKVVIRFAGDSGDGMQLTGTEFTKAAAIAGNDISTFPDFPAEIRAPAGSLAGVSGFQLHFSSSEIHTPGDAPDVLVVMNPAALRTNIDDLVDGGLLIINSGTFSDGNVKKAGYETNPLESPLLDKYRVHIIDISKLTLAALEDTDLSTKEKGRSKNFFALGLLFWMYSRDPEVEISNIKGKFGRKPRLADANIKVFKAGFNYGENAEVFQDIYRVESAKFKPGVYRNITGNEAISLGLLTAAHLADKQLFYSGYPITPASSILHYISRYKNYGALTFQAEDEIAAVGAAIGGAYAGALAVTASSGPGIALKGEGLGLAMITEVPMIVVSVQRGGPSTGLPTKTEQADLLQAMFGRNGESPLPILAAKTPGDCFYCAIEAARIATKYMVPVILLTDGYLANGAEPWRLPDVNALPTMPVTYRTDPEGYQVYGRDADTLARDWVIPGTPGLEHRIGGLEKDFHSGNVSYDPSNHERMTRIRAEKVDRVSNDMGPLDLVGDEEGDVLIVGWGGTFGALRQAAEILHNEGKRVSHVHLRYIHPLNPRLEPLLGRFEKVLVPELNMGQLSMVLRARFLIDIKGLNKIQGQPFKVREIVDAVRRILSSDSARTEARTHA